MCIRDRAGAIWGGFILAIAFIFTFGFVAASWHRFVLLEETPKIFGSPAMGRALPYIGNTILLSLWLLIFIFPFLIVIGFILAAFTGESYSIGSTAINYGLDDVLFEIVVGAAAGTLGLM